MNRKILKWKVVLYMGLISIIIAFVTMLCLPCTMSFLRMLVVFLIVFAVMFAFYMWNLLPETPNKLTKLELAYCICCVLLYFIWAIIKPLNYGPDEYMRYNVSKFFFENNRLPQGKETISSIWGFSYAHLPTYLCSILSYIPMKIVGIFTEDAFAILVAARFVSVVSGAVTVCFVIKTAKLLLKKPLNWIVVLFVSMLPQVAFLSSYVNNDILALMGGAIILYAWCYGYKSRLDLRICVTMAIGIIVCALSYYNSYGWILLSIIYFVTYYIFRKEERKNFLKYGFLISGIVLVGISYCFIRHLVLYNDLLGFRTSHIYGELYALDEYKTSARLSVKELGVSLPDMLLKPYAGMVWIESAMESFVEKFGPMSVNANEYVYVLHKGIFLFAAYVMLISIIFKSKNITLDKLKREKEKLVFYVLILFSMIIPFVLTVINSYTVDYQAQGRYFIGALLGYALIVAKSLDIVMSKIRNPKVRDGIVYFICITFVFIMINEFCTVYYVMDALPVKKMVG